MGVRICPNCGGKVSDKLDTCIHCNYKFIDNKKCPDCLERIPSNASSCPICGHPFTDNLEVKKVSINCPNCGSFEVVKNDDEYICASCNSKFLIKDNKPTIINKNYISNIVTKGNESSNILLTILDVDRSREDFLKEALTLLNDSRYTPMDIFNFEVKSLEVERYEFVYSEGLANVNYSRVIGFDREETYTEYETKYDKDIGKDIKVPVTKKRIVTDWRPDNGAVNGEASSLVLNYEEKTVANLYDVIDSINLSKDDILNPIDGKDRFIFQSTIDEIKESIIDKVFNRNIRYIGDHQKNVSYTGVVSDLRYTIFDVPFYNLTFTHKDKTYNIVSSAYKNISVDFGYNKDFIKTEDEKKLGDIIHKINSKLEKYSNLKKSLIIGGFMLLIFGIFSFSFSLVAGFIFTPIGMALIISGGLLAKKINNIQNKMSILEKEMLENMMNQKEIGYKNKLVELGLRVDYDVKICPKSNSEILDKLNGLYLYNK